MAYTLRQRVARIVYLGGAVMLGFGGFLLVAIDDLGLWSQTATVDVGRTAGGALFLVGILGIVVAFVVEPRRAKTK